MMKTSIHSPIEHLSRLRDEELVKHLQAGNQEALVVLMRRYKEAIINFAYRYTGNYDEAVDIAQETFVRLFRFAHKYAETARFTTWLFTIAANQAKSELRKKSRRLTDSLSHHFSFDEDWDIPDAHYVPDTQVDTTTISQRVQAALMAVSPTYREVIIMRELLQLSYEEICQVTECEMGTVKSRINRARRQMQVVLKDLYEEIAV